MSRLKNFTNRLHRSRLQTSCRRREPRASREISLLTKLCYAAGGVPYAITSAAINISLQIFLLDVVQMEAFHVSLILLVSRAWDAVTDPLLGCLVSRSRWTRAGKLTPWLVVSCPPAILSYLLLWFVPPASMSGGTRLLWFLAAACMFETLMSCYNVPYLSLSMFLGGDQRGRDSATAYRMSAEVVAMLLASVIQGQVVSVFNAEKRAACEEPDASHQTSSAQSAPLQETHKAFLTSGLVVGAVFFLCSLVLFLGVKEEQRALLCCGEKVPPSYLTSLKMLLHHGPYQKLVLGFVFTTFAFQVSLGNFALFCSHAAGLGEHFQQLLLVLLVSASVAVPLWQLVLLRIGKKPTVFIGLSLFIPAVIFVACFPSNLPVFMSMCTLMGFSVATTLLLPWSMLPDVVDDFAERHPSCRDLEPLFFSCYAFCSKLAGGLAAGLSTMTLQFVGYRAGACNHDDGVALALILLFSPVPIALLLVGMAFFHCYPINERQNWQLRQRLHPQASSSSSSNPVETVELSTIQLHPRIGVAPQRHSDSSNQIDRSSPGFFCSGVSRISFGEISPSGRDGEAPGRRAPPGGSGRRGRLPERKCGVSSRGSHVKVSWV